MFLTFGKSLNLWRETRAKLPKVAESETFAVNQEGDNSKSEE
jgi:hypothetical protein